MFSPNERERAETFRKQSEDKWENNCAAKETGSKTPLGCRKWKIEIQPIRFPTPSSSAPLAQLTHICEHKSISARLLEGLEQKELLFFSRKSCASLPRLMHYALCAVLRDESRKLSSHQWERTGAKPISKKASSFSAFITFASLSLVWFLHYGRSHTV